MKVPSPTRATTVCPAPDWVAAAAQHVTHSVQHSCAASSQVEPELHLPQLRGCSLLAQASQQAAGCCM